MSEKEWVGGGAVTPMEETFVKINVLKYYFMR